MNEVKKSNSDSIAWWVIVFFILCLIFSSWVATQYEAAKFGYQPALGSAWFSIAGFPIYGPFEWITWTMRWSEEKGLIDEYLSQGMYVFNGGIALSILLCAFINYLRTRNKGTPDNLHGSAHWATDKEIRDTGLISKDGVCVGSVDIKDRTFMGLLFRRMIRVILRDDQKTHVLMAAPTRSGKGVGVVLPTLLSWRYSTLVHDVKMENFALTSGFRHKAGQLVLNFNPTCKDGTAARWNPLDEIRIWTIDDVRDAQNISAMVADPEAKGMEDHWVSTSYKLLTGVFLHIVYSGGNSERSLTAAAKFIADSSFEDVKQMLSFMLSYEHDPEGRMSWRDESGRPTTTHPEVMLVASEMLKKEEKELGSVISSAVTKLGLFTEPIVAMNVGVSDFRVRDLMNLTQPVSCYYIVPPADKERLRPLSRLFFAFVIRRLTEEMKFEGGKSIEGYKHRLLLMMDELPSLRKLDVLQDGLAYIAGYGLKAVLIIQDMVQLKEAYGDKESVSAGCHLRIAYAPNTMDEAKPLSDMLGKKTVEYETRNHSGSRTNHALGQVSLSTQMTGRELMTPDELLALPPTDMILKASGFSPVRGKKLRYFEMPVFQSRAEIAPPVRCSIEYQDKSGVKFVWGMLLVEKDATGTLRAWLNLKDRELLPPVFAAIKQDRVVDGVLTTEESLYDFIDGNGVIKSKGPFSIANQFNLQSRVGNTGDIDLQDEFSVSLQLVDHDAYISVKYGGEFIVMSSRKKQVIKKALKNFGHEVKLQDAEKGSKSYGIVVLVDSGYVVQDTGYGNAVMHRQARLTSPINVGQDYLVSYDAEGKLGTVVNQ